MKDKKRALRRYLAKVKYARRLNLQLRLWKSVWLNPLSPNEARLYRPIAALVVGTEYERCFYKYKSHSAPCSCYMCSGHKKYKRKRHALKMELINELQYESRCDRLPRIR